MSRTRFNPIPHLDNLVVAFINGRRAKVITRNPGMLEAIVKDFTVKRRVRKTLKNKVRFVIEQEEAYSVLRKKEYTEVHCFSGLIPRLVSLCNKFHVPLQVVDVPKESQIQNVLLAEPLKLKKMGQYMPTLRDWQRETIPLFCNLRFGRIQAATGGGKSYLIAAFCAMAQDYRIAITVDRISNLEDLYNGTRALGLDVQMITGNKSGKPNSRIVCCSTGSLKRLADVGFDILIGDEVHSQAGRQARVGLWKVNSQRTFGFSANQDDRSDGADLWVEAVYGPIILDRTYEQNMQAGDVCPIEARFYDSHCVAGTSSRSHAIRERALVVRNQARNRLIAKLARYYLGRGHQVLILTRTTEHCLQIQKELPEAMAVFKPPTPERAQEFVKLKLVEPGASLGYTDKELIPIQEDFKSQKLRCVVANSLWHRGKDFPDLDVLIRADAMCSDVSNTQLSGRLSRVAEGKEIGILVDFNDTFDSALENRAKVRKRFYKKQGWKIV